MKLIYKLYQFQWNVSYLIDSMLLFKNENRNIYNTVLNV